MAEDQNKQNSSNAGPPQGTLERTNEREVRAVKKYRGQQLTALVLLLVALLLGGALWLLLSPLPEPPSAPTMVASPRLPIPSRPAPTMAEQSTSVVEAEPVKQSAAKVDSGMDAPTGQTVTAEDSLSAGSARAGKGSAEPVVEQSPELFQVQIGPVIRDAVLQRIRSEIGGHNRSIKEGSGSGLVMMTRLREGRYPKGQAKARLAELKQQAPSAFMLPAGDQIELFVGSFRSPQQAEQMRDQLAQQGLAVEAVATTLEMSGTMLHISDLTMAEASRMTRLGNREKVNVVMSPQTAE